METSTPPHSAALELRRRWQQISREPRPAVLNVGLLASYTIEPVVPYLSVALDDAGLPAQLTIGPFNQIMQQCLDDDSQLAQLRPDVLVVAPRIEELGPMGPGAADHEVDHADELLQLADAALSAAGRWRACLVYVLPAIPEERPYGAGDAGRADGVMARAAAAREAVRRQLAGRPNVCLADAEEAVRAVGARHAYRPSLFRFAKVPYAPEVFAVLGGQIAALLAARHGAGCRAVVIDADSLLLGGEGGGDGLRQPLLELRAAGVPLAVRATGRADDVAARVVAELPELAAALLACGAFDDRPPADQLRALCSEMGVPVEATWVLTARAELETSPARAVVLGDKPEEWPAELRAARVFDRLPPVVETQPVGSADRRPPEAGHSPPSPSLPEFVAGLDVKVTCQELDHASPAVVEVVARAKDFTLGGAFPGAEVEAGSRRVLAVHVRDRFGDYGTSGAVVLAEGPDAVVVDVFSLSCPVLGKGVEDAVMDEIVARADRATASAVLFRHHRTPHNQVATEFLARASARAWVTPPGREIHVRVSPDQGS